MAQLSPNIPESSHIPNYYVPPTEEGFQRMSPQHVVRATLKASGQKSFPVVSALR
jgi:hypothetical protein